MRGRIVSAFAGSALMVALLAGPASAAKPNNPGCLGQDVSSYARFGSPTGGAVSFGPGAGFGHFHHALATSAGVGSVIQNHMAGLVHDSVLPNTCND